MTDEDRRELEETKVQFEAIADMVEEMKAAEKNDIDDRNLAFDDSAIAGDLELLSNLDDAEQKRRDSLYRRRSQRESVRKRGGLRAENPFFDD